MASMAPRFQSHRVSSAIAPGPGAYDSFLAGPQSLGRVWGSEAEKAREELGANDLRTIGHSRRSPAIATSHYKRGTTPGAELLRGPFRPGTPGSAGSGPDPARRNHSHALPSPFSPSGPSTSSPWPQDHALHPNRASSPSPPPRSPQTVGRSLPTMLGPIGQVEIHQEDDTAFHFPHAATNNGHRQPAAVRTPRESGAGGVRMGAVGVLAGQASSAEPDRPSARAASPSVPPSPVKVPRRRSRHPSAHPRGRRGRAVPAHAPGSGRVGAPRRPYAGPVLPQPALRRPGATEPRRAASTAGRSGERAASPAGSGSAEPLALLLLHRVARGAWLRSLPGVTLSRAAGDAPSLTAGSQSAFRSRSRRQGLLPASLTAADIASIDELAERDAERRRVSRRSGTPGGRLGPHAGDAPPSRAGAAIPGELVRGVASTAAPAPSRGRADRSPAACPPPGGPAAGSAGRGSAPRARAGPPDRAASFVGSLGGASPGPAAYHPTLPLRPRRQGAGVVTSSFVSSSSRLLSMTAPSWGERRPESGSAVQYGQPGPGRARAARGAGGASQKPEARDDVSLMRERLGILAGLGPGTAGPIGPGSYDIPDGPAMSRVRVNPRNAWIC